MDNLMLIIYNYFLAFLNRLTNLKKANYFYLILFLFPIILIEFTLVQGTLSILRKSSLTVLDILSLLFTLLEVFLAICCIFIKNNNTLLKSLPISKNTYKTTMFLKNYGILLLLEILLAVPIALSINISGYLPNFIFLLLIAPIICYGITTNIKGFKNEWMKVIVLTTIAVLLFIFRRFEPVYALNYLIFKNNLGAYLLITMLGISLTALVYSNKDL